jgi:hypothetical protein
MCLKPPVIAYIGKKISTGPKMMKCSWATSKPMKILLKISNKTVLSRKRKKKTSPKQ